MALSTDKFLDEFVAAVKADRNLTDDDLAQEIRDGETLEEAIRSGTRLLVDSLFDHITANAVVAVTVPKGQAVEDLNDPANKIGQTAEDVSTTGSIS